MGLRGLQKAKNLAGKKALRLIQLRLATPSLTKILTLCQERNIGPRPSERIGDRPTETGRTKFRIKAYTQGHPASRARDAGCAIRGNVDPRGFVRRGPSITPRAMGGSSRLLHFSSIDRCRTAPQQTALFIGKNGNHAVENSRRTDG